MTREARPRRSTPGTAGPSTPSSTHRTAPAGGGARPIRLPERYEDLGRIGRGGWGEIRRARDRNLDRIVVVKVLAWDHLGSPGVRGRFMNEANITASLEHPGVVPVYDRGVLTDARPWFSMKEVRGQTLEAVLKNAKDVSDDAMRVRRIVDIFARVCETVGYAHGRGVVHRDLKPSNIMVGEFGEVLVLDWGIAGGGRESAAIPAPSSTGEERTGAGDLLGTVAYMSPEQARGANDTVESTSDVFSLGLMLYEILARRPARSRRRSRAWGEAIAGTTPSLVHGEAEQRDSTVSDLVEMYRRAVAIEPRKRFADAAVLGAAVRSWLDGAARRGRASEHVTRADAVFATIEDMRRVRNDLRVDAARLLAGVQPHDPVERKVPSWRLEDDAIALDQRIAAAEAERVRFLEVALEHDPGNPSAHDRLAGTFRERLAEADAQGALADAARYEVLLRQHDRGAHARFLAGTGRVAFDSAPTGANIRMLRFVINDRRLVEEDTSITGRTPFSCELPAGSYLAVVAHPGHATTRYPLRIGRDDDWPTQRPGDAASTPIPLVAALTAGEVYIPAGWCRVGADSFAAEPVPSQRIWIDGFVIMRDPVTCAEYLAFLDDLHDAGRHELAARHAPRWPRGAASEEPLAARRVNGHYEFTPDEHGRCIDLACPVQLIDWHSAFAYCAWLSGRTGQPWRLPNELEWEKAARGVDERPFPWGAQPEPTWARMVGSTAEPPCRAPVGTHPIDVSPYGVRDLAGNVRDWCANAWTLEGPAIVGRILQVDGGDPANASLRSIRGGAWNSVPAYARSAGRFAMKPGERFSAVGFRVARSTSAPSTQASASSEVRNPD